MSSLSKFWRTQQKRIYSRGIDRRHQLRRDLAYYVARYRFEIGDFSIGEPDIRHFWYGTTLKVGKYSSIAKGATLLLGGNHTSNTPTTFGLDRAFGGPPREGQMTSRGDLVIGSDVLIASNVLVLSGVTIGDGAVVGLGSVVVQDVPPYSIVFGNPARVTSKRFSDEVIAELLELRWWDLEPAQVESLRPYLEQPDIEVFLVECRKCRGLPPRSRSASASGPSSAPALPAAAPPPDRLAAQVAAIIKRECRGFSGSDMNTPFERLGIDSFGMVVIRTEIEAMANRTIDEVRWAAIATPGDMINALGASASAARRADPAGRAEERRSYVLNMPQMALGGLSESWLFKEFGDIHWNMLVKALGTPSHLLRDADGERLYATFTRFQLTSTCALAAYQENEGVEFDASMFRYGAGLCFSEATAKGDEKSIRARLMSSFSKIGATGSNTALLKGAPEFPAGCGIPAVAELPEFGRDYRARRALALPAPIFECEYEIIPSHDINGVGLLYFAAYPTINDICAARYAGRSFATNFSTVQRDVFYFGNSDPDDTLIYRLHRLDTDREAIDMEGSISRKSDGALMACLQTRKIRADRSDRTQSRVPDAAGS